VTTSKLEEFLEESIRLSRQHGYNPTAFIAMKNRYGTIGAISRLVVDGTMQSGFVRLKEIGLLNWSIEAAVEKFPHEFSSDVIEAAKWRLAQVQSSE